MTRRPTLLPCPFCGRPPLVHPVDPARDGDAWTTIACGNEVCRVCPRVTVHQDSGHRETATRIWNTRT